MAGFFYAWSSLDVHILGSANGFFHLVVETELEDSFAAEVKGQIIESRLSSEVRASRSTAAVVHRWWSNLSVIASQALGAIGF